MESENIEANQANKEGISLYGGKYLQYNILGNLFEVSAKYAPPIHPVGRGAYGIVWYLSLSLSLYTFFGFCFDIGFWLRNGICLDSGNSRVELLSLDLKSLVPKLNWVGFSFVGFCLSWVPKG